MSDDKVSIEDLLKKAAKNADADRKKIYNKLSDLEAETVSAKGAQTSGLRPELDASRSFSKYIENLQRSNEQLIKVAEAVRKADDDDDVVFDMDELYENAERKEEEMNVEQDE